MTFFVVPRRTGPQWRGGPSLEEQSGTEHAAFMDSLVDAWTVRLDARRGSERP